MKKVPDLQVTKDFLKDFSEVIAQFRNDRVLVGIPESNSPREGDGINNATLLAINNFGSPSNNIPPRPVMEIGIYYASDAIAKEFENVAKSALSSEAPKNLDTYYRRAGIIASQSIKNVITDQIGVDPPSDVTLDIREARGFKGTKSLIVTAQLRNAITYVLRGKS